MQFEDPECRSAYCIQTPHQVLNKRTPGKAVPCGRDAVRALWASRRNFSAFSCSPSWIHGGFVEELSHIRSYSSDPFFLTVLEMSIIVIFTILILTTITISMITLCSFYFLVIAVTRQLLETASWRPRPKTTCLPCSHASDLQELPKPQGSKYPTVR